MIYGTQELATHSGSLDCSLGLTLYLGITKTLALHVKITALEMSLFDATDTFCLSISAQKMWPLSETVGVH